MDNNSKKEKEMSLQKRGLPDLLKSRSQVPVPKGASGSQPMYAPPLLPSPMNLKKKRKEKEIVKEGEGNSRDEVIPPKQ